MSFPRSYPPEIGNRIKAVRTARGLTMADLAGRSGVSKSMVSQIERGQTNPTFATLWSLTATLGMTIQELIDSAGDAEKSEEVVVVPAHGTPFLKSADGKCSLRILSPTEYATRAEWYEIEVEPGGELLSEAHAVGMREHLTVLSGTLAVRSGQAEQTLKRGETARYHADREHCIRNPGKSVAHGLLVLMIDNERPAG
jgi:transcriptional regulator with XRE-family HTH domain